MNCCVHNDVFFFFFISLMDLSSTYDRYFFFSFFFSTTHFKSSTGQYSPLVGLTVVSYHMADMVSVGQLVDWFCCNKSSEDQQITATLKQAWSLI